ncbi:MAG: PAS domain S-box protein [Cyanobacteriota bacterium]|nr:PAS domain S-box protein [Cyanobacteriota bacterium]
MNNRDRSTKNSLETIEASSPDASELEILKAILHAERELTACWAQMEQAASGRLMQRSILLKVSQLVNEITKAQESSIFLLDPKGRVIESILARGATLKSQKQSILGQVFDKGLAGWVSRHHQIGLIEDTTNDERWLTLPNEPYTVRSALCVPILRGKTLLGLITLMHERSGHFNAMEDAIGAIADRIALVLDNVRLYVALREQQSYALPQLDSPDANPNMNTLIQAKPSHHTSKPDRMDMTGIFIMTTRGNLLYANSRFAEIFGYAFGEVTAINSIFDLVASDSTQLINKQIEYCFRGLTNYIYCTFTGRQKTGRLIHVELEGNRAKLSDRLAIIGIVRAM